MKNSSRFKVRLRGGFSDRNGIKKENVEIQYKDFDNRTRTAIINATDIIFEELRKGYLGNGRQIQSFFQRLFRDVYSLEVNSGEYYGYDAVMDI